MCQASLTCPSMCMRFDSLPGSFPFNWIWFSLGLESTGHARPSWPSSAMFHSQLNSSGHACLVALTSRIHTYCSFCAAYNNVTTPPAGTLTHKLVYCVKEKTCTLAVADRWLSLARFSWVINGQVWQRCGPTVDKDATGMQQTCHWHSVSVHGAVKANWICWKHCLGCLL